MKRITTLITTLCALFALGGVAFAENAPGGGDKCDPYRSALASAQATLEAATQAMLDAQRDLREKQAAMDEAERIMNEPPVTPAQVHAFNAAKAARDAAQTTAQSTENAHRSAETARDRAKRDLDECIKTLPKAPTGPVEDPNTPGGGKKKR